MPQTTAFNHIPSLDLADFTGSDEHKRQQFIADLGHAYENIGFIAVKNHLLSPVLEGKLYASVQEFFELPLELKQEYEIVGMAGQRGYTSPNKEHAKGQSVADLKEFWHFGQEVTDGDEIRETYPENIDVAEVPDFLTLGIAAFKAIEDTGREILKAISIHLELDENYFDQHVHNGNSILRPIHYFPIIDEPKSAVRAAEHEDINLITLLMGASAEGLEVQNIEGNWIAVTALPGHLVVNVGDMLQRLTNNKLKSTTHRVANPAKENWGTSRYSIPFFLHPRRDMPLNVLEVCLTAGTSKLYPDITAGEYLDERLREIGLLK
ncbi:MAG: 2-oxoglutarate and iron-dependent oxygenase domain-containing protein [Bacteroidota bacterium]|nr:2-oxoglutarate and iron-dependent oxygenase domain-containing protein [Bacteroidota bacterium]